MFEVKIQCFAASNQIFLSLSAEITKQNCMDSLSKVFITRLIEMQFKHKHDTYKNEFVVESVFVTALLDTLTEC